MTDAGDRHVVVVGAGPGGLTAAMLLAHRGFRVTVLEKEDRVGGRNGEIRLDDYRFDIGPTFLMGKFLLDEMFSETGRSSDDYLSFLRLDPMYHLDFGDVSFRSTSDRDRMRAEIDRAYPGQSAGFDSLWRKEKTRFTRMYPCLQVGYSSLRSMMSTHLLKALPHLDLDKSLYDVLAQYFDEEKLRVAFTFQSKYLGMSPWSCPAAFMIIPYLEYAYGVWHVMGGLTRISDAMARVVEEEGGAIRLSTPVARLRTEGRRVTGVVLEGGETVAADAVVLNADFGHAMTTLVEPGLLRKYTPEKLRAKPYSCSTFMLYLGLDTLYDVEHHAIAFAADYRENLTDISERKVLSQDTSFYVRNASVNDPDLAPAGHSAVYVLVPVANQTSGIDWEQETPVYRERILDLMEERLPMEGLRAHIKAEKVITPLDWEREHSVFLGATFNLAHTLGQMLYFRPRNRFEELDGCYLVGGGTHPGSGLPTIYESGRISANLVSRQYGVPFTPPPPAPPEDF